jgi:hypothetical protein
VGLNEVARHSSRTTLSPVLIAISCTHSFRRYLPCSAEYINEDYRKLVGTDLRTCRIPPITERVSNNWPYKSAFNFKRIRGNLYGPFVNEVFIIRHINFFHRPVLKLKVLILICFNINSSKSINKMNTNDRNWVRTARKRPMDKRTTTNVKGVLISVES